MSDINGFAHEIWAAAQLVPGEGIEDGVARIEQVLLENVKSFKSSPRELPLCWLCGGQLRGNHVKILTLKVGGIARCMHKSCVDKKLQINANYWAEKV